MPNTLAHLGVQTLATRASLPHADVRWIFAGAVIPDVPWIVGRATSTLAPALHTHELWAYLIAQSSFAVSLLLCGALAALAVRPAIVFGILAGNALLHLVIDALQHKWGNGVHILAPVTWDHWNAAWFGVESWPTYLLTVVGFLVAVRAIGAARGAPPALTWSGRRGLLAVALLTLYLTVPVPLRWGPIQADTNSVGTLRDRANRAGRQAEFDRNAYVVAEPRHYIRTYAGERLPIDGRVLNHPATISASARFVDDSTLVIERLHVHRGWPRNLMNYIGLALVLVGWGLPPTLRRPPGAGRSPTAGVRDEPGGA